MYVCLCKGLVEADVQRAARAGYVAAEALISCLGLDDDDCCGRCAREIDTFVELIADWQPLKQSA
jgi:bacterioferritin-associated ferredoxin